MSQITNVAVALLLDERRRLLLGRRPESGSLPGFWEFPGGKVRPDESPEEALRRELDEEIGVVAGEMNLLHRQQNSYGPDTFEVGYYLVQDWRGEIDPADYDQIAWVAPADLGEYAHLAGNREICEALAAGAFDDRLPAL